jgi:hypothetical protein
VVPVTDFKAKIGHDLQLYAGDNGMSIRKDLSQIASRGHDVRVSPPRAVKSRQAGMTTLGVLIMVCFVGLFAFAGIRLTPIYLNYMKVAGVLNGVAEEFDGQNPSRAAIRTSIGRRFDVESVSEISAKDITVTADGNGFLVQAKYDHTSPFIANVYFTVRFDKSVQVRR